jgi:heat shock protein HslJ
LKKIDVIRIPSVSSRLACFAMIAAAQVLTPACSPGGAQSSPVAIDPTTAPSAAELATATYKGVFEEPTTLTEGRWEGSPFVEGGASRPAVGLVDDFVLTGDLDEDGNTEAAVVLWKTEGGSGTRLYLAVMGRRDDSIANLGTTLIGDRVQIRAGVIGNGQIVLDLVRAGPTDAACCPTERAQVSWVLGEDGLAVANDEITGTLSLADLEEPRWILVELGWEQPVPEGSEITLQFVKNRAEGNTGCNSYFAGVAAGAPGEFRFNGMGTTRAACPESAMDLERRYLKTLAGATTYSFLGGRLVIGCMTEGGQVALVFTPREAVEKIEIESDVE